MTQVSVFNIYFKDPFTICMFAYFVPGEPFTPEELEEMMSQALDPEKGYIPYKDYASLMAAEET